jgi:hypothetical protein
MAEALKGVSDGHSLKGMALAKMIKLIASDTAGSA